MSSESLFSLIMSHKGVWGARKNKCQRRKWSCRISRSGVNVSSNSPCTTNTYVRLIKTIFSKSQVHCMSRTTNQSRYSFSCTVIGLVLPLRLAKSHDFQPISRSHMLATDFSCFLEKSNSKKSWNHRVCFQVRYRCINR